MEKILANALGQDLTKLAAKEKQLLLSRLVARFAHEIRNPLSSLDIHVQLLEEDLSRLDPSVRESMANRLEIIHGELHRLENIVKHFVSLAAPSSLERNATDVRKVIQHVCDLLGPEASARGIDVRLEVREPLPVVSADAAQLTQAVLNLVINAIQSVEREGRVEVLALRENADSIRIDVRDTGKGIPEDKLAALFEPFYTTKAEGSGLGLWIVQQIVLAHGGAVEARNIPGGGAEFSIHLNIQEGKGSGG